MIYNIKLSKLQMFDLIRTLASASLPSIMKDHEDDEMDTMLDNKDELKIKDLIKMVEEYNEVMNMYIPKENKNN